jgi:hypothetical protein
MEKLRSFLNKLREKEGKEKLHSKYKQKHKMINKGVEKN